MTGPKRREQMGGPRLRKDILGRVGLAVLGGHLLAVAICFLDGRWTWMRFAVSLQYVAIGALVVGAAGVLSQTFASPRYRQFNWWLPHSHILRDPEFLRYLKEERKRAFRFLALSSLVAAILYGSSRVILCGIG